MMNGKLENAERVKSRKQTSPSGPSDGDDVEVSRGRKPLRPNYARPSKNVEADFYEDNRPTIPITKVLSSAVLCAVYYTTFDPTNVIMMRQDMHFPVASSKKRAQKPADNADQNSTPECTPEILDVKSNHHARHPIKHQRIDDQNEKAKSDKDQRHSQDKQDRAHKGVKDAQQKRCGE
jgi:hypothetical protein